MRIRWAFVIIPGNNWVGAVRSLTQSFLNRSHLSAITIITFLSLQWMFIILPTSLAATWMYGAAAGTPIGEMHRICSSLQLSGIILIRCMFLVSAPTTHYMLTYAVTINGAAGRPTGTRLQGWQAFPLLRIEITMCMSSASRPTTPYISTGMREIVGAAGEANGIMFQT